MRRAVKEGMTVEVPMDFAKSLVMRNGGLQNVLVMIGNVENYSNDLKWNQIQKISTINDVEFVDDGILARRYSNIGSGKLIKLEERYQTATYKFSILTGKESMVKYDQNTEASFCVPQKSKKIISKSNGLAEPEQTQIEEKESKDGPKSESKLWACPVELCRMKYLRESDLIQHTATNKHSIAVKNESKRYVHAVKTMSELKLSSRIGECKILKRKKT